MDTHRLYIQLGSQCNCDCIFCAVADSRNLPGLSFDRVVEHLTSGAANGFAHLTISGGEPTIRRDLPQIVSTARRLGFSHIQVQTNARALANRQITERLFEAGVDKFLPSIHGHNADVHDAIMRAKGAFNQTVRGIANIVALQRTSVSTNTVITKQNYAYLPQLGELLISLGVKQAQLSYVQAEGNAKNAIRDIGPAMSDAYPFLQETIALCSKAGVKVLVDGIPQCVLSGYHIFARDMRRTPRVAGVTDSNDIVLGRTPDKLKAASCTECRFSPKCGGVWQKYVEMYGWSEFSPVPAEASL
jgi:MoaA/NifB/PqqE/SkfB family radical SAM enzyme